MEIQTKEMTDANRRKPLMTTEIIISLCKHGKYDCKKCGFKEKRFRRKATRKEIASMKKATLIFRLHDLEKQGLKSKLIKFGRKYKRVFYV